MPTKSEWKKRYKDLLKSYDSAIEECASLKRWQDEGVRVPVRFKLLYQGRVVLECYDKEVLLSDAKFVLYFEYYPSLDMLARDLKEKDFSIIVECKPLDFWTQIHNTSEKSVYLHQGDYLTYNVTNQLDYQRDPEFLLQPNGQLACTGSLSERKEPYEH